MKNIETVKYQTINTIVTSFDYYQVVASLADSVIYVLNEAIDCEQVNDKDDLLDLLNDSVLHETIDGSEWAIYNCHHLTIIQNSSNDEYMSDNLGAESLASALEGGLSSLHSAIAFWCLYADVMEIVNDILEDYEED